MSPGFEIANIDSSLYMYPWDLDLKLSSTYVSTATYVHITV